jgi:hypothetical protein
MALVAHGWTAPSLVDPAPEAPSDAITRFVEGLAALPGAEYVLAVDAEGDRVRGEAGGPPTADLAVLTWARRVATASRERRHALEDLVVTTERAFHVVRLVDPDGRGSGAAWVSVRIDRERGNLASSRRALAGLGTPGSSSRPRALPAGPSDPQRSSSRPPEPDGPRRAWPRPEDRAAAKAQVARERAVFAPEPDHRPWPHRGGREVVAPLEPMWPALEAAAAPSAADGAAEAQSGRRLPLTVRQAARWRNTADDDPVDEPAASVAWIPPARTSPETAPGPAPAPAPTVPDPRTGSLFAPAIAPAPPVWPVPEDDTGEISAPAIRPATPQAVPPADIRPRPYVPDPGPAPDPAPDPWPAPEVGPDPDASEPVPDLPRRRPGAHLAPGPVAPRSVPAAPASAAAGTAAFTTEHSVLRRLLDGLRRLT